MKAPRRTDLYPLGHEPRPFESTVFDDTLDAHPPYHLYEGTLTAADLAAARAKAAEFGLSPGPAFRVLKVNKRKK